LTSLAGAVGGDVPDLPSPGEVSGAIGALFGARAAGRGLARLLGPATDEIAEGLRRWTAYRVGNVERVVNNATAKIEEPDQPGQVPPRVAMRILEEGSYSDDEFVVEYLGGVLASSRTPTGRDDRGNSFAALISRMSTYELRTHYVCYTIMRQLLVGRDINLNDINQVQYNRAFIPFSVYIPAMDFGPGESQNELFEHAIYWLVRDSLIEFIGSGSAEVLNSSRSALFAKEPGMVVGLTVLGVALYLWAHGQGGHRIERFLDPGQDWEFQTEVAIPVGSQLISEMARSASESQGSE
jgi:hypothetical protein